MSEAPGRASRLLLGLGVSTALAVQVFVLVPAMIYLGNRDEFQEPLVALVRWYWPVAAGTVAGLSLLAAALPAAGSRRLMAWVATGCLLWWLQSAVLVWHYGLLDGRSIDWTVGRWRGWFDAAVWVGSFLAVDRWRRVWPYLTRAAIAITAVQAMVLATGTGSPAPRVMGADQVVVDPAIPLARFSPRANVLHILADGFQADVFGDLAQAEGPDGPIHSGLVGFTYYRGQMAAFPYTHLAVPALVSGRLYDNQQPLPRFMAGAMGEGSIFHAARLSGFTVQVGVPEGTLETLYGFASDASRIALPLRRRGDAWRRDSDQALLLGDLTLFRALPHFLKRYVYNDQAWLLQSIFGNASVPGELFFAHNALLRDMAGEVRADSPTPVYTMLHLMLLHSPTVAASDCGYAGRVLPPARTNLDVQARCSLDGMLRLFAAMRRAGVYDQTTIVISGDHGAWLAPRAFAGNAGAWAEAEALGVAPSYVGHANPLLLVKPAGSRGALRVSDAQTWITDVPATIAAAAGIAAAFPGIAAQDVSGARQRRFFVYDYSKSEWAGDYLADMQEYIVDGPVSDVSHWRRGGLLRAPTAAAAH